RSFPCLMLVGQASVGFWVSLMVMVKEQGSLLFPAASVATQATVVVPTGKLSPDFTLLPFWSRQATVTPGQLSAPLTVKLTTAEHWPASVPWLMLVGQAMVGFWVSSTSTVKEQTADLLPAASVAWA